MAYYPDLSEYEYMESDPRIERTLNVGWLDSAHPFPIGPVPERFVERLLLLVAREPVNRTRGWHTCELCNASTPIRMNLRSQQVALGDAEIRVRAESGDVSRLQASSSVITLPYRITGRRRFS